MAKKKGLPYNKNPYETIDHPNYQAPKPAVTTKRHRSPTGCRGGQKPQKADGERFNRGAKRPWKPPGRRK